MKERKYDQGNNINIYLINMKRVVLCTKNFGIYKFDKKEKTPSVKNGERKNIKSVINTVSA
jgi:hypothetical protein